MKWIRKRYLYYEGGRSIREYRNRSKCPMCGGHRFKVIEDYNNNSDADGNRGTWFTIWICLTCKAEL